MPYTLVLNSSNVIGSNNSIFKYNFIGGSFTINKGSEMCVSQIIIPYSWFNISKSYYSNAVIQYKFPRAGTSDTYTITLQDGYYDINSLNNAIQLYMVSQNQYFYNTNSIQNLYYLQLITNITYYSNQIVETLVPISLPTNYSIPTATTIGGFTYTGFNCNPTTAGLATTTANYYPTAPITTQFIVLNNFGSIIGFNAGTYPSVASSSAYNVLSNTVPNLTPVNGLVIRSNLINNQCAMPSDILDTMSVSGTSFGSNINYSPSYEKWVSIQEGTFTSMTVTFQDQNFNTIQANDPNSQITLIIRQGIDEPPLKKLETKNIVNSINFKNDISEE